jgi:hypothetical protein
MFCALGLILGDTEGAGSRFHVFAPGLFFGATKGARSHFHVLRCRTHFRRYRGRRVPFLCFALLDSFWAVSRASGPVSMFCAPILVLGGTEGVRSRFHVLLSRTHFGRYRWRRVPFSCFALQDSCSTKLRASNPVCIFCPPGLVLDGPRASGHVFFFCALGRISGYIEGVKSSFHVFRSQTHFGLYRGRRNLFPCFALPDSFSAGSWASVPVFMYRGRQVQFPCFSLQDLFCVVPRASSPVFLFCALGRFFAVPRASGPVYKFCIPEFIFYCTEGVGSRLNVVHSKTHFG